MSAVTDQGLDVLVEHDHMRPDIPRIGDSRVGRDVPDTNPNGGPFPLTCSPGAVYHDSFTSDPLLSGALQVLVGTIAYDATNHLLALAAGNPNTQVWTGPRPSWKDYTLTVPIRIDSSWGDGGINLRMEDPGPVPPPNDSGHMYYAGIHTGSVVLGVQHNAYSEFVSAPASFSVGTFHTLQVTAIGSALSVAVDNVVYINNFLDTEVASGGFGFRTYNMGMSYGGVTVVCH